MMKIGELTIYEVLSNQLQQYFGLNNVATRWEVCGISRQKDKSHDHRSLKDKKLSKPLNKNQQYLD